MNINELLKTMTLEEKIAIVSGTDSMYTNPVPGLSIPSVSMADGPHGLRKQLGGFDNGVSKSEPSTAFPTAAATASGWNPDNTYRMGQAIADECLTYGVDVLLGPGVNIKRNPRAGRNFEYFSEDPLLAGKMAAAEVCGVQSKGIGVSVKHFALNNAEEYRFMGNSVCDMRAMREIYLKVFELTVKESNPYTVMCAYNKINGEYCSQNGWLLNDTLRDEWGFDGVVMTDWGAMHDRVASLRAGLDLEMPGDAAICRKWISDGVRDGSLPSEILDKAVENVLRLAEKFENKKPLAADFEKHHTLSAEIAADCAVLLKNDDGILPLNQKEKLLVVGDLFEKMRYQGSGSSMINPTRVTTPRNAFEARGIEFDFARGYAENETAPRTSLIDEAVSASQNYSKVLAFVGLTDITESEGCDRENLSLPQNQLALINALIKAGKKAIVVLYGGSVAELPFADDVPAILNMFLPGQNGGTATADLLFGDRNPSGKLAETWVKTYADVPFGVDFSHNLQEIYKESVFVGYRYYLNEKKAVRYPFGYGLSYTTFTYGDIHIDKKGSTYTVSCTVTDTGDRDGAEVVQIYVKAPQTDVFKPEKELRAFTKVYLKAGESKTVSVEFCENDLRYFNIRENRWVLESGEYEIQICSDCMTVKLAETVTVDGERLPSPYCDTVRQAYTGAKLENVTDAIFEEMSGMEIPPIPNSKPITLESRFSDLKQTFMGRILFNAVLGIAKKQLNKAKKMPEGSEKDNCIKGAQFMAHVMESNSLICMSMAAGKMMRYNFACGFMNLANGHFFKGIRCFCTNVKAPQLPKNTYREEE